MKNNFILLGAAALALVACNKSETVVTESPQEVSFKAVSNAPTRADEQLEGTSLYKSYTIYASATQKKADGTIENAAYFTDQPFRSEAEPDAAGVKTPVAANAQYRHWDTSADDADPIYWPIGGGIVDFIAYAMPTAKHGAPAATYDNSGTDVASKVAFTWDTYANQVDLLYAVNNGATTKVNSVDPYVKMVFKHAQALLVFQAKTSVADLITIDGIKFDGLKVNGTFTVDNSKNTLVADWTTLTAVTDEDVIPAGADPTADNLGEALTSTTDYEQVGSTLLIPQQPRLNFTITYTVGANQMTFTYNDDRGVWEMGKKYIYKLDIAMNEIILTQEVVDWVDAGLQAIELK